VRAHAAALLAATALIAGCGADVFATGR